MDRGMFARAVEAHNLKDAMAAFAEDAVLHSPVTFKPIEGREAIGKILQAVAEILGDFRYTDQLESEDGTLGLIFRARIGEREAEGIDILRFNKAGLIKDITVMMRPRSALEAFRSEMETRLVSTDYSP
jgi:hypothetical protein